MSPNNSTRLRQIAFLATDIAAAEQTLTSVFGSEVIFRDPHVAKWGLQNILVPIGGDVLEVCAPMGTGGSTSAERFIAKQGGDCGYMIIMQTNDAVAQREEIESQQLAKVAWTHVENGAHCIQYSPKGIPGGVMPELDSQTFSSPAERLGPWYPCGPDYQHYSTVMARTAHLQLLSVTCHLAPGCEDTESAARKWEQIFGVPRQGSEVVFTNARLRFTKGTAGSPEGLESITIGVSGHKQYKELLIAARQHSKCEDDRIVFLGVEWRFVSLDSSRL